MMIYGSFEGVGIILQAPINIYYSPDISHFRPVEKSLMVIIDGMVLNLYSAYVLKTF